MKTFSEFMKESYSPPANVKRGLMKAFRAKVGTGFRDSYPVKDQAAIKWLNKTLGTPGSSGNVLDLGFAFAVYNLSTGTWYVEA